ncbi:MAG: RNA methyltransferase [bacterium]|nr:RNA methyltransferase [bacterium]
MTRFDQTEDALKQAWKLNIQTIAAEITDQAQDLQSFSEQKDLDQQDLAIVFGNEVDGVLESTLDKVDKIVYIPMHGIKESLNIGQSAAIFMRALSSKEGDIDL